MSGDISQFLEEQKLMILEDKRRLDLQVNDEKENCDNANIQNNNPEQSIEESQENIQLKSGCVLSTNKNQTLPFVEPLDLNSKRDSNDVTLEEKKQAYIDKLTNAENPFTNRSTLPFVEPLDLNSKRDSNNVTLEDKKQGFIDKLANAENPFTNRSDDSWPQGQSAMLRYGEYSPNNPQVRGAAPPSVPFLGLGEYDQRRNYFLQKQRAEYLRHLATIQYGLQCNNSPEKELSPRPGGIDNYYKQNNRNLASFRVDQRLTSAQNALLNQEMDKPKSILSNRRTGSPRERLLSDLYGPSAFTEGLMNSSYHPSLAEELERERIKRDVYQQELRAQIEEKRRAREVRDELELAEREAENSRLERQLARLREERAAEERRGRKDEQMRRHSEDLLRRKQELQSRHSFRKHTDSESSLRNNPSDMASKPLSHYSPPVCRRNPPYSFNIPSTSVFSEPTARYNPNRFDSYHRKDTLNRMDSLNSYEPPSRYNNTFSRFDSLSRIDSLTHRIESMNFRDSLSEGQRRHSATQQDLSAMTRRSPRLQRRNSSGRFEDSLPTPQLTKRSPVARELRNAIPCKSDASRRLEDPWQYSSVQKNSMDLSDSLRDGQSRSILTQLGAIRMQLQQEQFRMDETLRKRGITQSKAVDFH